MAKRIFHRAYCIEQTKMKILGLKQRTLPSYTWVPHSFWDTQRNPRALKNKTKYYWADWFLWSLWASMKPFIPRVQKKGLKNTLRFGEFRKPASQRPSKKPSCGKCSWWIREVIFFSFSLKMQFVQRKKAILNKLYNRKTGVFQMLNVSSRCISHSSEFTNSHHSLSPGWDKSIWNISSSILPAETESQRTLIISTFREI